MSNTGPLISLEKLQQGYDFIRQLYDTIVVPPAVLEEVAGGEYGTPQAYLRHYGIDDLIEVQSVSRLEELPGMARLHAAEAQAIQLARELHLPLLIEETAGRRVAQSLGISISGIAGQILKAFHQGNITVQETRNRLLALFQAGRINREIYEALLTALP